mmetsp:Transcript_12594/g.19166  ORF Transcript_12594/g.19166 Transcript_12594/m.19166 type:complete len:546 (+) Transcript_12594:112-1749(+)
MFPNIEASEVGASGLAWLFMSYGYVLYYASGLISEGSDLLLLVPSLAGLVGGVVLPLLGAVPDGAIMLFSGLGDIETAQETLSVGVGALAGSTIMLLTVPWGLSVLAGRVSLDPESGIPKYTAKPKLNRSGETVFNAGVSISDEVKNGGVIMMVTTLPYFLIQIPAMFLHGTDEEIAKGEKYWALGGLIICVSGFSGYIFLQWQISRRGSDRMKRVAAVKKALQKGAVSLSGALSEAVKADISQRESNGSTYGSVAQEDSSPEKPSESIQALLNDVLHESFLKYDTNGNGDLDRREIRMFFRDFHESIEESEIDKLFDTYDTDNNGAITYEEFIDACYSIVKSHSTKTPPPAVAAHSEITTNIFHNEEEEEEEVPEDISHLSPDEQQAAIKKRAFTMLIVGTCLVVLFSDPMVEVMQEIAVRLNLSPFYVSFILAPLASNASEVLASQYYAAKKTRKSITVALTALEGAASMNNTFCLSIFMALIYFRGLAWEYTAETIAIVLVQFVLGLIVQAPVMTSFKGLVILSIFPASILLVMGLEAIGFD